METSETKNALKRVAEALGRTGAGSTILKSLLAALAVAFITVGLFETNEAGYTTVKQSLFTGKVSIISEPGIFCQCLGSVTKYKEAGTFKFAHHDEGPGEKAQARPKKEKKDNGFEVSEELEVRFNDGATGWISGMALFDLPKDKEKLSLIHQKFRSYDKLLEVGIVATINESVTLTAALMNSGESYTTKRAIFTEWAREQLENGTYVTEEVEKEEKDPITGDVIKNNVVRIKMAEGNKVRNENPLERYGIRFKQFQITDIRYESETENIIRAKREALQQTIAAKIGAERAIQERLAAEELGKKNVKIAEYEAMVSKKKAEVEAEEEKAVAVIAAQKKAEVASIEKEQSLRAAKKKVELEKFAKEQAIIEAEKEYNVSKLKVKSAEMIKKANIFEGQGEAEKKRLVYKADGALQQKLDAYVTVMTSLAKELGKQKWVPDITVGGQKAAGDENMAMNFMNMWMMKAAKDIGVEMMSDKKGAER